MADTAGTPELPDLSDANVLSFVEREIQRVVPYRRQVATYVDQLKASDSRLFPASLMGIIEQSIEYHELLEQAVMRRNVEFAAWASRGLLEMKVWSRYIADSGERRDNLERNYYLDQIDMLRALPMLNPGQQAGSSATTGIAELIDYAQKQLASLPATPIRTSSMVRALGLESEYFPVNQFLSKLVHPSAFLLVSRGTGGGGVAMFLAAVAWPGLTAFLDIWSTMLPRIRNHLATAE